MQSINENDLFESSDISLISALVVYGAKIEAVERGDGPRAVFQLRREKGLDQLVQAYWAHELRVDPAVYFAALKEVKTRLYSTGTY